MSAKNPPATFRTDVVGYPDPRLGQDLPALYPVSM